jgi:hypothetical protein
MTSKNAELLQDFTKSIARSTPSYAFGKRF